MDKKNILIHGLGNIGTMVLQALSASTDLHCVGVIRRPAAANEKTNVPVFNSLDALLEAGVPKPQAVILCVPSRVVPELAPQYLHKGIATVDSYDIHQNLPELLATLAESATAGGSVAVSGAGWDPGTDSVFRALFEAMTPQGSTFTNFGPGRSMGHTVAAKTVPGVKDAVSLTLPAGGGRHSRLVYILLENGFSQEAIRHNLQKDAYFAKDPLELVFMHSQEELAQAADNSHGVCLERHGAAAGRSNQRLLFDMRIDNPALTAQVLTASARAALRLSPGAYTLIDIPPVALLPGDRDSHIRRLV